MKKINNLKPNFEVLDRINKAQELIERYLNGKDIVFLDEYPKQMKELELLKIQLKSRGYGFFITKRNIYFRYTKQESIFYFLRENKRLAEMCVKEEVIEIYRGAE